MHLSTSRTLRGALLALVLPLLLPAGLSGQSRATGSVDAGVRISPVAGATKQLFGAGLWLAVGDVFRFGGGAWALPRATRAGTLAQSGLELDFGYGGVGVEWSGLPLPYTSARVVVGAGSATAIDRATGSRVDSEGFFLLEPTLDMAFPILSWITLSAEAGWRFTFGVEDLTHVDPDDLDAWVLGMGIRFGPF